MDAGFGGKLMRDCDELDEDVGILCGANPGYEGLCAVMDEGLSAMIVGSAIMTGCAFQLECGLCDLHGRGLKPIEGRIASCAESYDGEGLHEAVAATWDTDEGRRVLERWRKEVGY